MRKFVCAALALGLILSFMPSSYAGKDEPAWADTVKTYYPYWKSHYWVDRELWGNQGYIIGGPPKKLNEGEGMGALNVAPVTAPVSIKEEEPIEVAPTKASDLPMTHVVKKGECLWYIAGYKEIYANPLKWPLIYKANKDKIKNPDLIYPGQVLSIPRD